MIRTVCGDISDDQLGPTLAHEHLCCDISGHSGNADNRMLDWELIADELRDFVGVGGSGIFEVTPVDLNADPVALRQISQASGVHVVRGISFYQEEGYPDWLRSASVTRIADFFVREIEEGTAGVPAGFIGEIGSHNSPQPDFKNYRLRDAETRVFQAAAKAQRRSEVLISTHASLGRAGHAQLDVLEEAGADLSRVVIGHCDAHGHEDEECDLEYYRPILQRGAYLQFDLISWNHEWPGGLTDPVRAQRLARLIEMGHAEQIMLSTDTCRLSQLHAHGGRGYDYIWTDFLPLLRQQGVTQDTVDDLLVNNPRRAIAI